jgi:enoyl-CoA hydratase
MVKIPPSNPDIIFSRIGKLGKILLNRPKALNALNLGMVEAMQQKLDEWEVDPGIRAVLVEGAGGRAFCAGGDIRRLAESATTKDPSYCREFFSAEFNLNRKIFRFAKPYVAILDGITMGGGVGLSVHAPFRVATESTLFAMPETGIGYFPDVGASYFLPRCPSEIGMYLGLTGNRLDGQDSVECGIATHYVKSEQILQLVDNLEQITQEKDVSFEISKILRKFSSKVSSKLVSVTGKKIQKCFSKNSMDNIFEALEQVGTEWSQKTISQLNKKSPLSLKVTFRQLREGQSLDFESCMVMELRLALRFMEERDFYEGVRAVIIEKDNKPNWKPKTIEEVLDKDIEKFFLPLIEGDLSFD